MGLYAQPGLEGNLYPFAVGVLFQFVCIRADFEIDGSVAFDGNSKWLFEYAFIFADRVWRADEFGFDDIIVFGNFNLLASGVFGAIALGGGIK